MFGNLLRPQERPILERVDRFDDAAIDAMVVIDQSSQIVPFTAKDFYRAMKQAEITAARMHGRIVGYVLWRSHSKSLTILRFGVRANHRRLGIGKALIHDICKRQLNHRRRVVAVLPFEHCPFHDAACYLLKSCGFHGNICGYEGDPKDNLVFTRKYGGA